MEIPWREKVKSNCIVSYHCLDIETKPIPKMVKCLNGAWNYSGLNPECKGNLVYLYLMLVRISNITLYRLLWRCQRLVNNIISFFRKRKQIDTHDLPSNPFPSVNDICRMKYFENIIEFIA